MWTYMRRLQEMGHEVTVIVFRVGKGITLPPGIRLIHVPLWYVPKMLRAYFFDKKLGNIMARERFDFALSLGRTSHQDAVLLPGNHLGYLRAMGIQGRSIDDRLQIMMDAKGYAAPGTILACSDMMRNEVIELYNVPAEKIKVLYPPTDTARFHRGLRENRMALRERFGMRPDRICCVLVSASHGRKGLPLLLNVFEKLIDKGFDLYVAGAESVGSDLPNVHSLGFVKDTENLFAAADFTLLPALYEPFGQVVSESLMCGTPVIVSKHVGAKAVIGEKEGLVLPDLDPETWLKAIQNLPHQEFKIEPGFAERHGLSVDAHLAQILSLKQG